MDIDEVDLQQLFEMIDTEGRLDLGVLRRVFELNLASFYMESLCRAAKSRFLEM